MQNANSDLASIYNHIYIIYHYYIYIYVKINHGPQIRPFWASHMKHHTKARPLMSLDCFGMALGWIWDPKIMWLSLAVNLCFRGEIDMVGSVSEDFPLSNHARSGKWVLANHRSMSWRRKMTMQNGATCANSFLLHPCYNWPVEPPVAIISSRRAIFQTIFIPKLCGDGFLPRLASDESIVGFPGASSSFSPARSVRGCRSKDEQSKALKPL